MCDDTIKMLNDPNRAHLFAMLATTTKKFRFTITKPFRAINEIVDWVRLESVDSWHWSVITSSSAYQDGEYIFEFDSEQDAVAFCLRWMT